MYWLILLRPYSPSRLKAWSDGTTPVISCMMIDELMYGFMPSATTEKLASPPPEKRSSNPKSGLLPTKFVSCALSIPGTGTLARSRKTISSPRTYRIRRRMSGARKAFSRDSNTG